MKYFFLTTTFVLLLLLGYSAVTNYQQRAEIDRLENQLSRCDTIIKDLNYTLMQFYYQHEDDDSLMVIINNSNQ